MTSDDHGEYTDPMESGLRSGKGTGFFRRLLFGEPATERASGAEEDSNGA